MQQRVVVIGGGVGGLAAAMRLARGGFAVTLLEKNDRVGGKLNLREVGGYRFDTGPSLLTLPFVFDDLFHAVGRDVRDLLPITKLDPIAEHRWADGMTFRLRPNLADQLDEVRRISPGDVEGYRRFLAYGEKIWRLAGETFLMNAPEEVFRGRSSMGKLDGWESVKAMSVPLRIGMFGTYARVVERHVKHPRLREVLYQYATYSGASPFKAPATLAVIPYVEQYFGGWYVQGGMYKLAEVLLQTAIELGVTVRTNAAVTAIDINEGKVQGVRVNDEHLPADAVLCNVDVVSAYRHLIEAKHRPKYDDATLNKLEPGGSGFVLLLGLNKVFPSLAHHTKFMPADYASDLRAMFETRTLPDDPCIYLCAATRTDGTQAPAGGENLFVLCSAPALDGTIDWTTAAKTYRDRILTTLEQRFGLTDLREAIVVERQFTPEDLSSLYAANAGSIYGIGSNSRRTAFLRPPNRDKHVKGLYFAGGATHPGGGLPLVALSGRIAAAMVAEDLASQPGGQNQ